VLFSERDACWKVTDFGSAALATSKSLITTSLARGTDCYRAPEVLDNRRYNNRADVFALGCIVFEIITGQKLFSSDWAVHEYAQKGSPIIPEQWPVATPGSRLYDLGQLTSTLLSIEPTRRPGAVEIRRQLRLIRSPLAPHEEHGDQYADDEFFSLQNFDTPAPTAAPNPTVLPALRFPGGSMIRLGAGRTSEGNVSSKFACGPCRTDQVKVC